MQHWARTTLEGILWDSTNLTRDAEASVMRIVDAIEARDVHLFRTEELSEIADELSDCTDLQDLSSLMWSATTSLRFQNFAVFIVSPGTGLVFNPKICTSFNKEWVERYIGRGYQYVDPVMQRASEGDGWFKFSELRTQAPAVEAFWKDAENNRIGRNGVCFAMTRTDGTRVAISLSTKNSEQSVDEIVKLYGKDLTFLARLACDAFCYASSTAPVSEDMLTTSELRFLYTLSTASNPEDALKISSCFGSNETLQSSIRRKLRVSTVFQAIAIAASKGWFKSLPYENDEVLRAFGELGGSPSQTNDSQNHRPNIYQISNDIKNA